MGRGDRKGRHRQTRLRAPRGAAAKRLCIGEFSARSPQRTAPKNRPKGLHHDGFPHTPSLTAPASIGRGSERSSRAGSTAPTTGNCSSNTASPKSWASTMAGSNRRLTTRRRALACARSRTRRWAMRMPPTCRKPPSSAPPTRCARSRAAIRAHMPTRQRAPMRSCMARIHRSAARVSRPRRGSSKPSMPMPAPRIRACVRFRRRLPPLGRRSRFCAATARLIATCGRWCG